ncbi:MAG: hypothetical protein FWD69_09495 [Polyangiaceae bacterium]|nr:hypothetical protein [Polyangiaceae bacterium]
MNRTFHLALPDAWSRLRFAVLSLITYAYFYQGADPNQHSRIFLTDALLRRSVDITPDHGYTIDKSFFHERFLADKAPGISALAVPIRAVMGWLDRLVGAGTAVDSERARMHFLAIVLCGIAGVVSTLWVGDIVESYGANRREKTLSMVAYGFGTLVFPFSTVLFGHSFAAMLILACFRVVRGDFGGRLSLRGRSALFGFLGSLTIVTEYPTAVMIGVLAISLVLGRGGKPSRAIEVVIGGALGALPLLALHAYYLKVAFGSPFSMPYSHVFEPVFRMNHDKGLLGINLPSLGGIYGISLSPYRGLLFMCPHLLLAIFGFAYWLRDGGERDLRLVATLLVAYLLFSSAYYAWDGGGSTGPRHFIPALAFLSIPFFFFIRRSNWHFWLGAALAALSVFFMFTSTAVLVHQPEGEVFRSSPLYEVILPSFFRGELALNTQDVRTLGPRADAAYNLGMLAGLKGLWSLAPLAVLWLGAYLSDIVRSRTRGPAEGGPTRDPPASEVTAR